MYPSISIIPQGVSWALMTLLFISFLSRSLARPSLDSDDGRAEPAEPLDWAESELSRVKVAILNELGLHLSVEQAEHMETLPKSNISQAEYQRAYGEYMRRVQMRNLEERALVNYGHKSRRRNAKRIMQIFNPGSIHTYDNVETRLDFNVNLNMDERRSHHRVRKAIVKLPLGCYYFDLERNETLWGRVDLTQKLTYWILTKGQGSEISDPEPFGLTVYCSANEQDNDHHTRVVDPFLRKQSLLLTSLKVISSQISNSHLEAHQSRRRRSYSLRSYETHPALRSRDCDKTRHGKTCCRRSMKINFEDLSIRDLILEPKEFDAHMCSGRCNARRVPFATTHAMLQHTLHQSKGRSEVPRPCCTPTKLRHLDVLHTVPGTDTLKITILANAIVEECSCS